MSEKIKLTEAEAEVVRQETMEQLQKRRTVEWALDVVQEIEEAKASGGDEHVYGYEKQRFWSKVMAKPSEPKVSLPYDTAVISGEELRDMHELDGSDLHDLDILRLRETSNPGSTERRFENKLVMGPEGGVFCALKTSDDEYTLQPVRELNEQRVKESVELLVRGQIDRVTSILNRTDDFSRGHRDFSDEDRENLQGFFESKLSELEEKIQSDSDVKLTEDEHLFAFNMKGYIESNGERPLNLDYLNAALENPENIQLPKDMNEGEYVVHKLKSGASIVFLAHREANEDHPIGSKSWLENSEVVTKAHLVTGPEDVQAIGDEYRKNLETMQISYEQEKISSIEDGLESEFNSTIDYPIELGPNSERLINRHLIGQRFGNKQAEIEQPTVGTKELTDSDR